MRGDGILVTSFPSTKIKSTLPLASLMKDNLPSLGSMSVCLGVWLWLLFKVFFIQ